MKWEPWIKYKSEEPVILDIYEPPCKHCKFWKPVVVFNFEGENKGVRCCAKKEMFQDFSCYRPREDEDRDIKTNPIYHQDCWTPASHGLPPFNSYVKVILHNGSSFIGTIVIYETEEEYDDDYFLDAGPYGHLNRSLIAFWKYA